MEEQNEIEAMRAELDKWVLKASTCQLALRAIATGNANRYLGANGLPEGKGAASNLVAVAIHALKAIDAWEKD